MELKDRSETLIARAGSGDHVAFTQLYREFASFAYSVLRRQLGPSPCLEDLLQQVFLKVFRELPEYRGDRPFRAWLRRACNFAIYDHLRRERRHASEMYDDAREHEQGSRHSAETDPEETLQQAEVRRQTLAILERLTPEKRMALVMHDLEGQSLAEVAEVLGAPKFTVRTRLVRARREFADLAIKNRAFESARVRRPS